MNLKDYALIKKTTLTDIGDGIREQEGSTEGIPPEEMKARILALGGSGIEYTTGTVTFTRNYDKKSIEHGLSKLPKLFFLYWNEYTQSTSICLTCVYYTEKVAGVMFGSATEVLFNPAYATMVGVNVPTYGGVTVNNNTVDISAVARQWEAGDWTWEAWTW